MYLRQLPTTSSSSSSDKIYASPLMTFALDFKALDIVADVDGEEVCDVQALDLIADVHETPQMIAEPQQQKQHLVEQEHEGRHPGRG